LSSPTIFGALPSDGEPDYSEAIQNQKEYYDQLKASDIESSTFMPRSDRGAGTPTATGMGMLGDAATLIFGDEMSSLGFAVDKNGLDWELERAKDFWAEHPVRATLGLANTVVPFMGLAYRGARAARFAGISDDMLSKGLGYEMDDLARMAGKDKELLKVHLDHMDRYNYRIARVDDLGIENVSLKDKAYYYATKAFHNTYHVNTDPKQAFNVAAEWRMRTAPLFAERGEFSKHLADLPPDEIAPQLSRYLMDSSTLEQIPEQYRPWAMRAVGDLKNRQATMLKEGMLTQKEATAVGDVWVNTTRVGTARDYGNTTVMLDYTNKGDMRMMKVPRTSSVNLLNRKTTSEELRTLVDKQAARELLSDGKVDEALGILGTNEGFSDVRDLIQMGELGKASKLLSTEGQIDFTPKAITFDSLFTQGLLHESYRFMRDIALNGDVTKSKAYISALSVPRQRNWMNLDDLAGSDRIRRMVAVSRGLDPDAVDELGYVPKAMFTQLQEFTDGTFQGSATDLLKLGTAIMKTAKTAGSPATQVSNALGNGMFLINAGVNPFTDEFGDLIGRSAGVVWNFFKMKRGKAIDQTYEAAGIISSKVGKGTINIAEEFASPELSDLLEFKTMMSNDATMEGLGAIERMAKTKSFAGWLAGKVNKGADKSKVIPVFSDAYMAADAIPKMAYYLDLRQRGFNRASAALEVGRRMPMYQGVGAVSQAARGWFLPWVTFSTEATRILKNNMQDYPFRTAMMLQVPGLAQVGSYSAAGAMGKGMTPEGIQDKREQLPGWADRPNSIITPIEDRNGDLRSMTMDFLPYSAVMPPSIADDVPLMKKMPFGLDEPMPILMGLGYALSGKDSWGNDVPTDPSKPYQKFGMMAMNLAAFFSPPILDRYLFDPTQAKFGYKFLQETGKAVNPYTEKLGDPTFDFFVNNFTGIKMYSSSPEQQLANESFVKSEIQTFRGSLSRQWQGLLKSGDTENAAKKMQAIAQTFTQEYKDPGLANRKMIEWMKSHTSALKKHPQLRNFSKEELTYMLKELESTSTSQRTRAKQELLDMYRRELKRRGRQSMGGTMNPYIPTFGNAGSRSSGGGGGIF